MRSADYLNIAALIIFIVLMITLVRHALGKQMTALDRLDAWLLTACVAVSYLSTTGFIGWGWYTEAAMAAVFWMLPWCLFRLGRILTRKRAK